MSGANAVMTTYKTIPEHVLAALGYTIRGASVRAEPVISDQSFPCPAMGRDIAAGEVAGTRIVAEVSTQEGVTAQAHIETRLFREGEIEHMFWSVDGLPRTRIRTERDDSGLASATSLFNRIPDVIAAPPGIVLLSQLGPLKHTALS
jgi:4-hydroxy-tetrahydrodipicolinate reductase